MRIIAGKARATKLYTLEGETTRPTLDRVKESIFNILQNEIADTIFLDLFSGSGAIGLEAASRGAKKVILCEKSAKAIQIINKNIEKTHLKEQVVLYQGDYRDIINLKIEEKLDIVYIDPPYKTNYVITAINLLKEKQLLKDTTIIIVETDREKEILQQLEQIQDIQIDNVRKYGRVSSIFLRKEWIDYGNVYIIRHFGGLNRKQ